MEEFARDQELNFRSRRRVEVDKMGELRWELAQVVEVRYLAVNNRVARSELCDEVVL